MTRKSYRFWISILVTASGLVSLSLSPARAVERGLLGIHIYSNVKTVLRAFGNPTDVLTSGQAASVQTTVANATANSVGSAVTAVLGSLPPLQPNNGGGAPVPAFGMGGQNQNAGPEQPTTTTDSNGEVTLVYKKGNGVTYEFLLSTSGSVIQITALGYGGANAKTTRGIAFGSSYTSVLGKYGYPETQTVTNGVTVIDYSKRAHVAFELLNNQVIGIVVAAVD
jgi:hypothetical protein